MDKKQLRQLSKNQLTDIILQLTGRVEELEKRLKAYENAHTPSSKQRKNNSKRDDSKPRFPGKPKGSNGGGVKIPPPDKVEDHTLDACPNCNSHDLEHAGFRKKTILDFPDKPIITTEHRVHDYHCTNCNNAVCNPIHFSNDVYGPRLKTVTTLLKSLCNSHDKIAQFFKMLGAPSFSNATVQNITDKTANALKEQSEQVLAEINKQKHAHADETGIREDGKNGYVWIVLTKTHVYFKAVLSRGRKIIKQLLQNFEGVLVVDGYVVYSMFIRQRCWSHLLREVKTFAEKHAEIKVQYERLKKLYEHLKDLNTKPPDEQANRKAKQIFADIITCLKTIKPAKKLVTLLENGGGDWFTALYHEGIPLDNNHAERELRDIVLLRKTIGCYRNEKGKAWIENVLSMIHTWKLQGKNTYQQLLSIHT